MDSLADPPKNRQGFLSSFLNRSTLVLVGCGSPLSIPGFFGKSSNENDEWKLWAVLIMWILRGVSEISVQSWRLDSLDSSLERASSYSALYFCSGVHVENGSFTRFTTRNWMIWVWHGHIMSKYWYLFFFSVIFSTLTMTSSDERIGNVSGNNMCVSSIIAA